MQIMQILICTLYITHTVHTYIHVKVCCNPRPDNPKAYKGGMHQTHCDVATKLPMPGCLLDDHCPTSRMPQEEMKKQSHPLPKTTDGVNLFCLNDQGTWKQVPSAGLLGFQPYLGVSENRGPKCSTLNSRILIIRAPK